MPICIWIRISMMMPIQIQIQFRISIKTMPILMRILPQVWTWKITILFHFWSALPVHNVLSVLNCQTFQYFWQNIESFWKTYQLFYLLGFDNDKDRPDRDRHPGHADPTKCCESDPIRLRIHNTECSQCVGLSQLLNKIINIAKCQNLSRSWLGWSLEEGGMDLGYSSSYPFSVDIKLPVLGNTVQHARAGLSCSVCFVSLYHSLDVIFICFFSYSSNLDFLFSFLYLHMLAGP